MRKMMKEFKDQPVCFLSVNTRNPDGQVNAEIKKFKMTQPVHYGRGQDINRTFKVKKLPRLIFIKSDTTIHKDVIFMNEKYLRNEIQMLLDEFPELKTEAIED